MADSTGQAVTLISKPELIIGLVAPIGTDLNALTASLHAALTAVGYTPTEEIRLSALLRRFPKWENLPKYPSYDYYDKHMNAGNELRKNHRQGDVLARIAMAEIVAKRKAVTGSRDKPAAGTAYILRSLKTPSEVKFLRSTYGDQFICVAAHSTRASRVTRLANSIATNSVGRSAEECRPCAEKLVTRDQNEEPDKFGQNVRKAFPLADVFVDASFADKQLERSFKLYLGHPFLTPEIDEVGLYYAHASSLRSASPARQVGAAILDEFGSVISVGTNEMPFPRGGLFSADVDEEKDRRQFRSGEDKSDQLKMAVIQELIGLLKNAKWLKDEFASTETSDLAAAIAERVDSSYLPRDGGLRSVRINQLIEFVPEVHGEMAALIDCARRGVSVKGATLYTTTFPCHDCAKHIIASGIKRVVYWDPYPKSLVQQLYDELVEVDGTGSTEQKTPFQRYIGLSPNRYIELFLAGENRKDATGRTFNWTHEKANFKLKANPSNYIAKEIITLGKIREILDTMKEPQDAQHA